jgi:hypothetical protein
MTVSTLVFVEDGGGVVTVPDHARDGIAKRKRPGHLLRRTGKNLEQLEHVQDVGPSSRSPDAAAAALRQQEEHQGKLAIRARALAAASNPVARIVTGASGGGSGVA